LWHYDPDYNAHPVNGIWRFCRAQEIRIAMGETMSFSYPNRSVCFYCGCEYMAGCVQGDCGCRLRKTLEELAKDHALGMHEGLFWIKRCPECAEERDDRINVAKGGAS
jgi:hypothetical protein